MKDDLPGAVRRVAGFLGMAEREDAIEVATRQTGIDFMRSHGHQFDDHLIHEKRNALCGLPSGTTTSKVRDGRAGSHHQVLTPELRSMLDEVWRREVTPVQGYDDYADLRAALASA